MENTSHNAMHQYRHEADEYRRIELITGVARRRRWSAAEKAAVVAESLQPGINVSMVARRHGVSRGLLQTWRRTALRQAADGAQVFVPLRIEDPPAPPSTRPGSPKSELVPDAAAGSPSLSEAGTLEIESAGLRARFSGPIDATALRLVLTHIGRPT
jgi:transposase